MSMEKTYIGSDEWLMDLKEYYPRGAAEYPDDIPNVIQYAIDKTKELESLKKELHDAKEEVKALSERNKFLEKAHRINSTIAENLKEERNCYREAREIIEQLHKDNFVENAHGFEDGYLDGLDTAMNIIDKALEESK